MDQSVLREGRSIDDIPPHLRPAVQQLISVEVAESERRAKLVGQQEAARQRTPGRRLLRKTPTGVAVGALAALALTEGAAESAVTQWASEQLAEASKEMNEYSGWAIQKWHEHGDPWVIAAQDIGRMAHDYGSWALENPGYPAGTLAVGAVMGAGAVMSAGTNPALRRALAEATNRTKGLMDRVRSDPTIQRAMQAVGLNPSERHQAVVEAITQGQNPTLPNADHVQMALGQDGALTSASAATKIEQKNPEATAAGTGQGEAAKPNQHLGTKPDTPWQGR